MPPQLAGVLLVLLSTAAVAAAPTAAKLALDSGGNTLTVVALRGVVGLALLGALLAGSSQAFGVERRTFGPCLSAGLFYALATYGFIGSVAHIPVSVAVPIFFTHPVLVVALSQWRAGERFAPRNLALALAVFAGIALVLGPDIESLDPVGVGLAALAAVAICGVILFTARAQEHATSTQANFHVTAVAVAVLAAATTAADAWSLPSGAVGWLGLAGAGAGVTVGLLLFFAAVLGERLGPWQWGGVALVIAALVLFEAPAKGGRAGDEPRVQDA